MELKVERFKATENETVGKFIIDGKPSGFTIEDEKRAVKVKGETRIPAGRYQVKLRTIGGHHTRYAKKYTFHRGMLWLQNVPGFEYILIHIGNTDKDTEGCLCIGDGWTAYENKFMVTGSEACYKRVYPLIAEAIIKGDEVWITVEDEK